MAPSPGARAQGVNFPVGRMRFYSPRGDFAQPAQGQALFYFGDDFGRFETVFGDAAVVLRGPR